MIKGIGEMIEREGVQPEHEQNQTESDQQGNSKRPSWWGTTHRG